MQQAIEHAGALLKMVILAPALPGKLALTCNPKAMLRVIVARANSDATNEEALWPSAKDEPSHARFNSMRPIHHRAPA